MKLLTYNIDGLNSFALIERATALVELVLNVDAEIVNMQEMVPEIHEFIRCRMVLNGYSISVGSAVNCGYYTVTFVKRSFYASLRSYTVEFTNGATSQQGRNLLITQITLKSNNEVMLIANVHLESCGRAMNSSGSEKRQAQLAQALSLLHSFRGHGILAGDLNIREAEAKAVLSSYDDIEDVAQNLEQAQKGKKFNMYTWMMPGMTQELTTNKSGFSGSKGPITARFDRIYYHRQSGLVPSDLITIGSDNCMDADQAAIFSEIYGEPATYLTPSDHRGVVVTFSLPNSNEKMKAKISMSSSTSSGKRSLGEVVDLCEGDEIAQSLPQAKRTHNAEPKSTLVPASSLLPSQLPNTESAKPLSNSAAMSKREIFLAALARRSIT